jgi:hypothetical protein
MEEQRLSWLVRGWRHFYLLTNKTNQLMDQATISNAPATGCPPIKPPNRRTNPPFPPQQPPIFRITGVPCVCVVKSDLFHHPLALEAQSSQRENTEIFNGRGHGH